VFVLYFALPQTDMCKCTVVVQITINRRVSDITGQLLLTACHAVYKNVHRIDSALMVINWLEPIHSA